MGIHTLQHQHRPEIVHIGVGGAGHDQVAQRQKVAIGVVAIEEGVDFEAQGGRPRKGVGRHDGTRAGIDGIAREAGAESLMLYHHSPDRTDAQIDEILAHHRSQMHREGNRIELNAAFEGMEVDLSRHGMQIGSASSRSMGQGHRSGSDSNEGESWK